MSLKECFEIYEPETWVERFGLNHSLFSPSVIDEDPALGAYDWVKRLLAVTSGKLGLKQIFAECVSKGLMAQAFEVVMDCPDELRPVLDEDLRKSLYENLRQHEVRKETLKTRVINLRKKNTTSGEDDILRELDKKLTDLILWTTANSSSEETLRLWEQLQQQLNEIEEFLWMLETEITSREKQVLDHAFDLHEIVVAKLRAALLGTEGPNRQFIERCFSSLPNFVLSGQVEVLSRIGALLDSRSLDRLPYCETGVGTPFDSGLIVPGRQKVAQDLKSPFQLRLATTQLIKALRPFEEQFESVESARHFVENKVKNSTNEKEASVNLLRGVQSILLLGDHQVADLQAKGLYEYGLYLLLLRRYIPAFDFFADSFQLWQHVNPETADPTHGSYESATGMILSSWIPRRVALDTNVDVRNLARTMLARPEDLFRQLVEKNDLEIAIQAFDAIPEEASQTAFLHFLDLIYPQIPWVSNILERVLQPRHLFKRTIHGFSQLRVLLYDRFEDPIIMDVVECLETVAESFLLNDKSLRVEIAELESHKEQLEKKFKSLEGPNSEVLETLLEGLENIFGTLERGLQVAVEVMFSARPVSTIYYLDDHEEDFDLIIAITLSENSLPVNALVVEARIEEKLREKVSSVFEIREGRIEIGRLETGSTREVKYKLGIDPKILLNRSEIGIALNYFDGSKSIEPTDKKHIFQLSLRNKRPSTRFNPYVAGIALEKGSTIYVGREKELDRIKSTLIGQDQDNIPLILGIRRIGKTSLLKRLMDDREVKSKYVPVFVDLEDMPDTDTSVDFFKGVCSKIHDACGQKWGIHFSRVDFLEDPIGAFDHYVTSFSDIEENRRVLVVFDECEKLLANLRKWKVRCADSNSSPNPREALVPEVLGAIRKAMQHAERISFVIAGVPEIMSSLQDYQERWFGLMNPIEIRPLEAEEARRLVQLKQLPYKVSSDATEEVLYLSGRQPYLIQLICRDLFDHMLLSGRETAARLDIDYIVDRYIIPRETYFTDYRKLIKEDEQEIIRGIASAQVRRNRRRKGYVSVEAIYEAVRSFGTECTRPWVVSKLKEMTKGDRPLVEEKQSRYRIIIGLLSKILEQEG